jgi:hypothetical protein
MIPLIYVAAAWWLNKKVKEETGKGIIDHAFEWYDLIREQVTTWAHNHPNVQVSRYTIEIVDNIDGVISSARKQLNLRTKAHATTGKTYTISEDTVSAIEVNEQFPGLINKKVQILTI